MTPEQVSALSDGQLNRAMTWLYPPVYINNDDGIKVCTYYGDRDVVYYDYLADYNLTMPLVIEKSVSLSIVQSCEKPVIALCGEYSAHDKSPLRAACECLVLIALADK